MCFSETLNAYFLMKVENRFVSEFLMYRNEEKYTFVYRKICFFNRSQLY
jgi:hypothetical protein